MTQVAKLLGDCFSDRKSIQRFEEILKTSMPSPKFRPEKFDVGKPTGFTNYTDYGRPMKPFFHPNPKLLGLGRQFRQINFGTFGVLSIFSINQPLFLQKTKPLYPNSKYLFGIAI